MGKVEGETVGKYVGEVGRFVGVIVGEVGTSVGLTEGVEDGGEGFPLPGIKYEIPLFVSVPKT